MAEDPGNSSCLHMRQEVGNVTPATVIVFVRSAEGCKLAQRLVIEHLLEMADTDAGSQTTPGLWCQRYFY